MTGPPAASVTLRCQPPDIGWEMFRAIDAAENDPQATTGGSRRWPSHMPSA